jgi:hypothetical protein
VSFRRAQYANLSVLISASAEITAETDTYLQFKYELFRKETAQNYTLVGEGAVNGLPRQTLKVVEDAARDLIESLPDWDARIMSARIFIYEV